MQATSHTITTTRSGRYYLWGELQKPVKALWILLHGYGYSAAQFLEKFPMLMQEGHVLLAPEGLSRFYAKGFSGPVGASWMTRYMREEEITDTMAFLTSVYSQALQQMASEPEKTIVLGFSQGGPAAARWVSRCSIAIDHLALYGSDMPADAYLHVLHKLCEEGMEISLITGTEDEFISEERYNKALEFMAQEQLPFHNIRYRGSHTIQDEPMQRLMKLLHL